MLIPSDLAGPLPLPAALPVDRTGQALFFVLSAGVLGYALQLSNGHQDPAAMVTLMVALGLALVGTVTPRLVFLERFGQMPILIALGLGLMVSFGLLIDAPPGIYLRPLHVAQARQFHFGLAAAAVLAGAGLMERSPLARWRMPALLLLHFLLGCWLIHASPSPIIDVDTMQREGVKALLQGLNPYALTFPNPYGSTALFGDKIATATRILVGFPYPPLSLYLAVPGQWLFGDYRFGQLAAMTASGALMAYSRPGRISASIATMFLFTPRGFFVLEQGWTDPFLVLLVAATVFAALRRPGWVPYLFGLLVVVKQYMVLSALFSWLLVNPFRWREFVRATVKAVAVALAVTVPLALWDLQAFTRTLFFSHLGLPFRTDALTYQAWIGVTQEGRMSSTTLGLLALAVGLGAWRCPRTPSGFASALVLLYGTFFFFGVHAFCNHYYFVIGLLCVAAAATRLGGEASPSVRAEAFAA